MTEQTPVSKEPIRGPLTFGSYLRNERKQAGHTLRKFSSLTNFAISTLSRWENDHKPPVRADVEKLDRVLGVRGRLVDKWEAETSEGPPPWMRLPDAREARAVSIDTVSVSLVPGSVQSLEYARAVFRAGRPTAPREEVERLAQLRVNRYESLTKRNDPLVTAVFPMHSLLHLPPVVKEDQVKHLLRHLERGRLVVYLIPDHVPILSVSSSMQLYRLADGKAVASSDHVSGNVLLEKPSETATVESFIRDLIGLAHPRSESVPLLEGLLHEQRFS
ncbi:helix-turn-helix domain-containing protein [Nocardiopsis lambiniae]|uniref:Helix-turn-helix transcriptional regulator n=1 Tax=Nocardiopsis lambiniae TaxID=3075539 RepID=A0ABU2MB28_9ACTN|nr:helix-turn-helix transcriptional regulator [Nocardiopsis sp. DSM 44743]MDT0329330.1 helix-turn-helix transcriptional regulator [Nocardiopsis sp. DSM 44743]